MGVVTYDKVFSGSIRQNTLSIINTVKLRTTGVPNQGTVVQQLREQTKQSGLPCTYRNMSFTQTAWINN